MEKLSAAKKREVLAEVPEVLRKVAAERDIYKNAYLENASRSRVEKIASAMIEKGIKSGSVAEVANEIEKQAAEGDLDLAVTEKAVELMGPDMGKRAHVSDELSSSAGVSDLERYLMS